MDTLSEICKKHTMGSWKTGTDKGSGHTYIPVYTELFEPLRDKPVRLLEVGIMSGHSILMWQEYFQNGTIYGVDVSPIPAIVQNVPRVKCIQHSSTDAGLLPKLGDELFDIIIDDGCHEPDFQHATAKLLFSRVRPGGFYIIEDVLNTPTVETFRKLYGDLRVAGNQRGNDRMLIFKR